MVWNKVYEMVFVLLRRCDKDMATECSVYLFQNGFYPLKITQPCVPDKSSPSSVYSNAEALIHNTGHIARTL